MNQRYTKQQIDLVRQFAKETNEKLCEITGLKKNQIIYIKQKYKIYKVREV